MKIRTLFFASLIIAACNQPQSNENAEATETSLNYEVFGDTINDKDAIAASQLLSFLTDEEPKRLKISGIVDEVCQKKGCWMTMDLADGQSMRVRFRDYDFFVPMDAAGSEVIIEGLVQKEITTVAELRHYAEDAGKSAEEIEAITEDEISISFEADGVLMRRKQ